MDITGIDKAIVLAALYNSARSQGMGLMHFTPDDMTVEQARQIIADTKAHLVAAGIESDRLYFDYLKGRVIKCDISRDELATALYDRDNGQGAAERAIRAAIASRTASAA